MRKHILVALLLSVFLSLPAGMAVADPTDYALFPHLSRTEHLEGSSNAVVAYSLWGRDFFALANEESNLHLYEVTGDDVVPLGVGHTTGADRDVAIRDWYAFVATGSGLSVVNIAVPENPTPAGFLNLTGDPVRIAVSATHAYVAGAGEGLAVVDITDLQNMSVVGGYDTPVKALWLDGDRLGVVFNRGFEILDVSVPQTPVLLGSFSMDSYFQNCVLQGDLAYVSSWTQVKQLDISDPAAITLLLDLSLRSNRLDMQGDELVCVGPHSLDFVDFATGAILRQSEQVGNVRDAAIIAGRIMAVGDDRVEIYRDGLHVNPPAEDIPEVSLMEPRGIMWGKLLYGLSLSAENTLVAADLGAADELRWSLALQTGGDAIRGMAHEGTTLVALSSNGKLFVLTVAINGAIVRGAVNLSDGFFTPFNQDRTVDFLDEQTVVVLDEQYQSGTRNIRVVDISDPEHPVQIGQYPLSISLAEHLMVAGTTVVATSIRYYEVFEASDPLALQSVATQYMGGSAFHRMYARGSYLYALHARPVSPFGEVGPEVLDTWDLSDPVTPVLVHHLNLASAGNLTFAGDFAYQAESGLILDLSDPESPVLTGNYCQPNLSVLNPMAVLADERTLVTGNLFDGSESSGKFLPAQGASGSISAVEEDLPVSGPGLSLEAVPNPFNPRVALRFELAVGGLTGLQIYDLRGRLVRDLGSRYLEAGSHSVIWEGVDSVGKDLPSGVYLARVMTPKSIASKKILLAR